MQIALIADIHGNYPALKRAHAYIRSRGIEKIYFLGDAVGKGPSPVEAYEWVFKNCEIILQGNWEQLIATAEKEAFVWQRELLGEERMQKLTSLPWVHTFNWFGREIVLTHGRPIFDADENSTREEKLAIFEQCGHPEADILLYADMHRQYCFSLPDGKMVYNIGSVGNNYAGNPRVNFAILHGGEEGAFQLEYVQLDYDREAAIEDAQNAEGFGEKEQYIKWVETGRYK